MNCSQFERIENIRTKTGIGFNPGFLVLLPAARLRIAPPGHRLAIFFAWFARVVRVRPPAVAVQFVNDRYRRNQADRNLYLDALRVIE
jgi:hypothetical protein